MSNHQLAFLLARITLGINFFLHGLIRIPKLEKFVSGIAEGFQESMLPQFLVEMFAYGIPFIEIILGFLLVFGIVSRKSLCASAVFIIILISGCALKEDWNAVATQMLYALFIFFLLKNLESEVWAIGKKEK
ncbi:DoxX family protein [Mesonia maritima]|uniref:Thiosulfate dehydrogenase [quinone] large subunit n=1 Tax=Mesonia maritima TaxID=1793873 RepID=A0ABU1K1X2_9FLAO|nr:DoxX family membrane protein [Mesonia maritima]MDR6299621.1 thiosulfate dehydrogenase [quinone] large subunit [Mesonia maritima]